MRSQLWRDVLPHVQDAQKRVLPFLPKLRPARYGFAAGVAMLFGGGGDVIRQSINFQTASTSNAVRIAATTCRVRLSRTGYSESVSIRSASAKSRSVRPPLL